MANVKKKDFHYYMTNLNWGDGTPIEREPIQFTRNDLFEHTYEMPGFYSIEGLVFKHSLEMMDLYPPATNDMSIDYGGGSFDADSDHPLSGSIVRYVETRKSKRLLRDFRLSDLNISNIEDGFTIIEKFKSGTDVRISPWAFGQEFHKSLAISVRGMDNRAEGDDKINGINININADMDVKNNYFFNYSFDAWFPNVGRLAELPLSEPPTEPPNGFLIPTMEWAEENESFSETMIRGLTVDGLIDKLGYTGINHTNADYLRITLQGGGESQPGFDDFFTTNRIGYNGQNGDRGFRGTPLFQAGDGEESLNFGDFNKGYWKANGINEDDTINWVLNTDGLANNNYDNVFSDFGEVDDKVGTLSSNGQWRWSEVDGEYGWLEVEGASGIVSADLNPTKYTVSSVTYPPAENGGFQYSTKFTDVDEYTAMDEWQTIEGVVFIQEDTDNDFDYDSNGQRIVIQPKTLDDNQGEDWRFYIKNLKISFPNTKGVVRPIEWEKFTSNMIVNQTDDYISPFYEENKGIIIGGLTEESFYYKTLTNLIGYDFKTNTKKQNFSYAKYNPYDVILGYDTLAKINGNLYDEYLNPYTSSIFYESAHEPNNAHKKLIHNNYSNPLMYNSLKDTSILDTDVATSKIYKGVIPMWQQLGFANDEFDKPNRDIYWKNIIPKDFDLSERVGITQRDLPDPMKGSLTPRIPRKEFIVDEEATQYWNDGYYWPVLPKFSKVGGFTDEYPEFLEHLNYGDKNSKITSIRDNDYRLKMDINFQNSDIEELSDSTGLNEIKYTTDFSLNLKNDRIVKGTGDYSDSIETNNDKQAF